MRIHIGVKTTLGFFTGWHLSNGTNQTLNYNGTLREAFEKFCNKYGYKYSEEVWRNFLPNAIRLVPPDYHKYLY
jgi:hypothetical protein